PQPTISFDGIYANMRMVHILTSVVGSKCEVQVKNGGIYEGVFKTYSPKCDLVLDAAHRKTAESSLGPKREDILESILFKSSDFVMVHFKDMDTNYARRGMHFFKILNIILTSYVKISKGKYQQRVLKLFIFQIFLNTDSNLLCFRESKYVPPGGRNRDVLSWGSGRQNSPRMGQSGSGPPISRSGSHTSDFSPNSGADQRVVNGGVPWPSPCPSPSSRPPSRYQSGPNSLPPRAATPTRPPSRPPSRPSRPPSHPSAHGSPAPVSTMPKRMSSEGPPRMSPKAQRHPRGHRVSTGRGTISSGLEFVSHNAPGEASTTAVARGSPSGGTWSSVVSGGSNSSESDTFYKTNVFNPVFLMLDAFCFAVPNMPQQRQDQHHQSTMMHPASAAGPPIVATPPAYSTQYVAYSPQQFPNQPLVQHVPHYQSQHPHVYSPVIQGNARMMAPPTHAQPGLVSSSATQYGAHEQTHAMYACPKIPYSKETGPSFYFAISTGSLAQQYAHPNATLHPHPPHPQPSATPTGQQQSQHAGSHPAPSPVQHHQHQAAQALHLANPQQQSAIYHAGLAPTPPSMTPGSNTQSPQNSFPTAQQTVFTIHPSHVQPAYTNPPHMAHVPQAHVQSGMVPSHPTAHAPMMLMTTQPPGGPQAAIAQSALQPIPVSTTTHFPYMTHPSVQAHHQQQL
uniref:Sm domain-containing protein n=1 Tax=Pavo cristatus TaxID=9049 RepID=A0A8C9L9D8_PAVCR